MEHGSGILNHLKKIYKDDAKIKKKDFFPDASILARVEDR